MWIVRLALRRPYTFVVMALLLGVMGTYVVRRTPTDIFPSIDIPVVSVVWTYTGLPAKQMEQQVTQFSEYALAGNVADIKRIESQSFDGVSVVRVYLQPDSDVASAVAQVTAVSQTIIRRMPPGMMPPIIVRYSATSVPILQLSFSSDTLSEAELFDFVNIRVRSLLSVVRGTRFPFPAGGKVRQIVVDLDLDKLREHHLTPHDINLAVSAQNLTLPTGNIKIAESEYRVSLNSSPETTQALGDIPVRTPDGHSIFVRDVANVHDGFAVQTNIARQDGRRSVVLSVLKHGDASTTEVAARIKEFLPTIRASAPKGMRIELLADQSTFVTNAIDGLFTEGLIAALLTASMILLFLGSWRSTLIIAVSIPLSVLSALLLMRALGQTINTMTLGGLALAVGILVDDATVEIENIHRNLAQGKRLTRAILDGAQQVALPAFVASLCISVVFVSVLFLEGPARYLFLPLGMAVGFSVMASYLLSRTLVPTLVRYLLSSEHHDEGVEGPVTKKRRRHMFFRIHLAFNAAFERFRGAYVNLLAGALDCPMTVIACFGTAVSLACVGAFYVGTDFFPTVDAGQIRLHVVAPVGTRLEETEAYFARVETAIQNLIPPTDRVMMLDQMGMPGGYNLAITDSTNMSSADGEILIALSHHRKGTTHGYVKLLRERLPLAFPDLRFYFQPADIVTQILNFGLPSPIDIEVSGMQRTVIYDVAKSLVTDLREVPGIVDVGMFQAVNAPRLHVEVDRARAEEASLTQRDVANNILLLVSSSGQVNPNYWIDPKSGLSYPVVVQVPEYRVASLSELETFAMDTPRGMQMVRDLATISRKTTPVFNTHIDVQPTFNVRADVQDIDLGGVTARIDEVVEKYAKSLPKGAKINIRGQINSMRSAFSDLTWGLILASILVYCVMVINFQSWLDPWIIFTALPGTIIGIVAALFMTQTTINIPSLMGALTSIGVSTANSILMVSFANERVLQGLTSKEAALDAGRVRMRPVLMTALAMVLGMLPMSLGLSEGAEQNAALGRAVIGGLCGATLATLVLVPVVYSVLRKNPRVVRVDPDLEGA